MQDKGGVCAYIWVKIPSGMIHELDAIHSVKPCPSIPKCLDPGDEAMPAHHNEKTCANRKE